MSFSLTTIGFIFGGASSDSPNGGLLVTLTVSQPAGVGGLPIGDVASVMRSGASGEPSTRACMVINVRSRSPREGEYVRFVRMVVGVRGVVDLTCALEAALVWIAVGTVT